MDFRELLNIMAKLRSEEGCPWDRIQTKESLKPYIIEEAYELIEAIEENDPEKVKEELGDLLFQIVFQCRIAEEKGEFTAPDVIQGIGTKMTGRHPHVFIAGMHGRGDQQTAFITAVFDVAAGFFLFNVLSVFAALSAISSYLLFAPQARIQY